MSQYNFGNDYNQALSNYNAMSLQDRAKLSGFNYGGTDEGGQPIWSRADGQGLNPNTDAGETAGDYVNKNTYFDGQGYFNNLGIIPVDQTLTRNGPSLDTKFSSPDQAQSWADQLARSYSGNGYNFNNYDDLVQRMAGPGQYVDDPTLGRIYVPNNRNSQTWDTNFVGASNQANLGPVNKFADGGGVVYGLAGGIAGLASGAGAAAGSAGSNALGGSSFLAANDAAMAAAGTGGLASGTGALVGDVAAGGATTLGSTLGSYGLDSLAGGALTAGQAASGALSFSGIDPMSGLPNLYDPSGLTNTYSGGGFTPGSGTSLTDILKNATGPLVNSDGSINWARLAPSLLNSGLGLLQNDSQRSSAHNAADKLLGLSQPSRDAFNATLQPGWNPSSIPGYDAAIQASMDAYLRGASKGGNPFNNPGVSAEALKYVTSNTGLPAQAAYRNSLAQGMNVGIPGASQAELQAANQAGGGYNAVAGGIGNLVGTLNTDLSKVMSEVQQLSKGLSQLLNNGRQLA